MGLRARLNARPGSTAARARIAPDLLTSAEAGVVGYNSTVGETVRVTKEAPEAAINRINADFTRALHLPALPDRLLEVARQFQTNTPSAVTARFHTVIVL